MIESREKPEKSENALPWYLFYSDSKLMHVFKSILGLLLFIQFLEISFIVSLDEAIEIPWSSGQWVYLAVVEVLFAIDFIINFLTVTETMKQPTLGKTICGYLKGYFFLDLIATVISNILFLVPGYSPRLWRLRLKTTRIFHLGYIRFTYKGIIEYMAARVPNIGKLIQYMIGLTIEMSLWLHILTCIWIKLGSRDAYEDRWKEMDDIDRTWMFREGSDFTSDSRTIYEQLRDESSPNYDDLTYLYIYALYFVLTVLTTVGYGHGTYEQQDELLYVIVLEALSAIVQAYSIVLIQSSLSIKQYSYKTFMSQRMMEVDEWMIFKI